jgi:hypothetical protein
MKSLALISFLSCAVATAAPARFALALGSNHGGGARLPLWFAERDAERFAQTLTELADFSAENVRVLKAPNADQVRTALAQLAERANAASAQGQAPLVVLFYSGHADAQGILLGTERLPYAELQPVLSGNKTGVRVAIVDACHSGALTQVKGARPAPLSFEIPTEPQSEGLAILTSASASEAAQESAALKGSFFTHHLNLGIRGAADADTDGRITLSEAYRYAYHRTLAATSEAGVLPQHPTYAMQIAGKGEVVLVDLRHAGAVMHFAPGAGRNYLVTHERSGEVVAEVASASDAIRLALPEGRYRVERLSPAPRLTGLFELAPEKTVEVQDAAMTAVSAADARRKGDWPLGTRRAFAQVFVASPLLKNFGPGYGLGVGVRGELGTFWVLGALSFGAKSVYDDGFAYDYSAFAAHGAAGLPFALGAAEILLGAQVSLAYATQTYAIGGTGTELIPGVGPYAAAIFPLAGRWSMRVQGEVSVHRLTLNEAAQLRASMQLGAAVEVGW